MCAAWADMGPLSCCSSSPKGWLFAPGSENHSAVAWHPYAQFLKSPVQGAHDGIYCSRCLCGSSAEYWFIQWLKWKYFCLPLGHSRWLPIKHNHNAVWHVQIHMLHKTNSHDSSSQAKMGVYQRRPLAGYLTSVKGKSLNSWWFKYALS